MDISNILTELQVIGATMGPSPSHKDARLSAERYAVIVNRLSADAHVVAAVWETLKKEINLYAKVSHIPPSQLTSQYLTFIQNANAFFADYELFFPIFEGEQ